MNQQTPTAKQTSLFDTDVPAIAPQLPQDTPNAAVPPPTPPPPQEPAQVYDWLAQYVEGRR